MSFEDVSPKSPLNESTLERVIKSTDIIRTGFEEIQTLLKELKTLKVRLQEHVSKLFGGFDKVESELCSRSHFKCIQSAILNCGSLCREIEEIMDQISHLQERAETKHSECLECFDFIKASGEMQDAIHEWMISINRSVSKIQIDARHSQDILNFTPIEH